MNITELVERLAVLQDKHGDLPIVIAVTDEEVTAVEYNNDDGEAIVLE